MSNLYDTQNLDKTINKLVNILSNSKNDYSVQYGDFYSVDIFELCDKGIVPSCYGNNSSNPYFSCAMEKAPGQTVPNFTEVENGKYLSFRLGFNEALVITGKTPPEVNYFSYCVFLTSRHSKPDNEATKYYPVMPIRNKPVRCEKEEIQRDLVFSCLGQPLNNLKINTPGTPDGSPGDPFDQPFLIVFTANQSLQKEIYESSIKAGFSPDSLNTVVIPQDIANLSVTSRDSDTFSILNRISSLNSDDPKLKEYLNNPGITVFRVTSKNYVGTAFPEPFLTPRGTGKTELQYSKPVEVLHNNILEYYQEDYEAVELTTDIWVDESNIAIQQGLNNIGEARDTIYFGSGTFKLPEDAFLIVYGANHAKTGKCTYSNAVVYGSTYDNGVISVNNKEFENSAYEYLKDPVSSYLYAWRFGYYEDSSYGYSQIPTCKPNDTPPHSRTLDPNDDIYLGFRAYVEPATKVGPSWNEVILDRAILFLKKKK